AGGASAPTDPLFLLASLDRSTALSATCAFLGALACFNVGPGGILAGAAIGWVLPLALARRSAARRQKKLNDQFIGGLEIMAGALKAGLSIPQALESTQKALDHPLSEEYSIMIRQMRVGMSLGDTLNALSDRIQSPDVKLAATAIAISSRTGANLPLALEQIIATLKKRNAVKAKIDSATFMGRAQGLLIGIMPFALMGMLAFISPQTTTPLFTTTVGHLLLGVVLVTQTIAYVMIKRITKIEV
ncbi:MAG: type II secretion system F family protein, partial [Verrucomicrobiia bacterium]